MSEDTPPNATAMPGDDRQAGEPIRGLKELEQELQANIASIHWSKPGVKF